MARAMRRLDDAQQDCWLLPMVRRMPVVWLGAGWRSAGGGGGAARVCCSVGGWCRCLQASYALCTGGAVTNCPLRLIRASNRAGGAAGGAHGLACSSRGPAGANHTGSARGLEACSIAGRSTRGEPPNLVLLSSGRAWSGGPLLARRAAGGLQLAQAGLADELWQRRRGAGRRRPIFSAADRLGCQRCSLMEQMLCSPHRSAAMTTSGFPAPSVLMILFVYSVGARSGWESGGSGGA